MKKILLICCMLVFGFAESKFSKPLPTFDEPRRVVFAIYQDDLSVINHTVGSMYNILKEYPSETLKIVVVAYGAGMKVFKKDYDARTLERVKSLMQYDVEFIGCRNTMETMKWVESDFIDGMGFAQAGIVELIERQVDGYIGITAY